MVSIHVKSSDLLRFAASAFAAAGMTKSDSLIVADVLIWANERGVDSHGISRMPIYLKEIERGEFDPAGQPVLHELLPATFKVECRRTAGPVCMMKAIDHGLDVAKKLGAAVGLLSEPTHLGAIGRYSQLIAQRGYAGIVMVAGLPFMAYHGAKVRSLGTSPISIGIPASGDEEPLVLDMATSVTAAGRISQAAADSRPLPPEAALDASGNPTTDARQAVTMLPLGGPKGSGLSLLFECLTGILAATPIVTAFAEGGRSKTPLQNSMIIVLNIEAFRPLHDYTRDIQSLKRTIKALPRRDGFSELLLPGERAGREAKKRRQIGIPLPADLWFALQNIASEYRIAAPQAII